MKITVGKYTVLDSGSVFSINSEDVVFDIKEGIKVRLKFTDDDNDTPNIKYDLVSDNEITIKLENFKSPFGVEPSAPLNIGTYDGKSLLLHFKINGMDTGKNKLISYTWLLGGVINNGKPD